MRISAPKAPPAYAANVRHGAPAPRKAVPAGVAPLHPLYIAVPTADQPWVSFEGTRPKSAAVHPGILPKPMPTIPGHPPPEHLASGNLSALANAASELRAAHLASGPTAPGYPPPAHLVSEHRPPAGPPVDLRAQVVPPRVRRPPVDLRVEVVLPPVRAEPQMVPPPLRAPPKTVPPKYALKVPPKVPARFPEKAAAFVVPPKKKTRMSLPVPSSDVPLPTEMPTAGETIPQKSIRPSSSSGDPLPAELHMQPVRLFATDSIGVAAGQAASSGAAAGQASSSGDPLPAELQPVRLFPVGVAATEETADVAMDADNEETEEIDETAATEETADVADEELNTLLQMSRECANLQTSLQQRFAARVTSLQQGPGSLCEGFSEEEAAEVSGEAF